MQAVLEKLKALKKDKKSLLEVYSAKNDNYLMPEGKEVDNSSKSALGLENLNQKKLESGKSLKKVCRGVSLCWLYCRDNCKRDNTLGRCIIENPPILQDDPKKIEPKCSVEWNWTTINPQ